MKSKRIAALSLGLCLLLLLSAFTPIIFHIHSAIDAPLASLPGSSLATEGLSYIAPSTDNSIPLKAPTTDAQTSPDRFYVDGILQNDPLSGEAAHTWLTAHGYTVEDKDASMRALAFYGWVNTEADDIRAFGYEINGETVWTDAKAFDYTLDDDDGISKTVTTDNCTNNIVTNIPLDLANAKRHFIEVDVASLTSGVYNITPLVKLTDGTVAALATWSTVTYVKWEKVVSEPSLKGASLTVGATLSMDFYAVIPQEDSWAVGITQGEETVYLPAASATVINTGERLYSFRYDSITPQCMTDTVDISLVRFDDATNSPVGDPVATKSGYSVKQYLTNLLDTYVDDGDLTRLLADTLVYGAAAQRYANYKTNDLATDGVDLSSASTATPTEDDNIFSMTEAVGDTHLIEAGVTYESGVNRLFFTYSAGSAADITVNINGTACEPTPYNGHYIAFGAPLSPQSFDTAHTVELTVDGTAAQTLTYSVNTYIYRTLKGTSSEVNKNLALALYRYGRSAKAYADCATSLYDLRVEDMIFPIGVDVDTPTFSWKMKSDTVGQHQSAYRVVITEDTADGTVVWNSGKVASGLSVDIPYEGQPLSASTRYRWNLTVWEKDGKSISATSYFETGLRDGGFADAKWISYDAGTFLTNYYAMELDMTVSRDNFGICFAAKDCNNLLMWQFNTGESDGAKIYLRPHVKENGEWSTFGGNIDITSKMGFSSGLQMLNQRIRVRIEVSNRFITTYAAPVGEALVRVDRRAVSYDTTLYTFGFRLSTEENGTIDNILVYEEDGTVLYENDFSSGNAHSFEVIGATATVKSGQLAFTSVTGEMTALYSKAKSSTSLPVFRKSFTPKGTVTSAKFYTSGLGVYESYINGERVGRLMPDGTMQYHELKPGASQAADRKYYSAYDVTHMFEDISGEAVLSATMGTGWWSGQIAANHGRTEAYLAKLILTYADGSQEVIDTDTTWQVAHASPFTYSDIFGGEDYDARVDTSWMLPGYDIAASDADWANATVNTEFTGDITAWMGSYMQVREDLEQDVTSVTVYEGATGAQSDRYGVINVVDTYTTDSFTLLPGQTALIDFGQNFAGWESFTVQGAAGTVLTIEHGEMLNDQNGEYSRGNDGPGGSLYNANNRTARAATVYTLRGSAPESYHPSLTYYGFRYIEITTTAAVTFTRIKGEVVTSVDTDTGWIETSHDDINQLISNTRWGQYSNYLSVPTDCPQRNERLGWTADTQVFAKAGAYLGYSKSFLEKFLQDMRDTQKANGAYYSIAPGDFTATAGWGATGWADAGIIVPYTLYQMFGDEQILRDHWSSMTAYMNYLKNIGGPANLYGDWLAYESNDTEIQDILSDAYYAWDCLMMADMADALGKANDAATYRRLYNGAVASFRANWVNANGTLKRDEQVACLYALYLDLLPSEASVAQVTNQLIANIQRNGNRLQTGFLGTKIILDTLTKIGRTDVAYTLLLQTDNPSWLYSVLQGATTVWERWDSYTKENGFGDVGMNSFNHYAYGAVTGWMFSTMAGIDCHADAPGFKKIMIAPVPDARIGYVKASYESAYGLITTESTYDGDVWHFSVTIPANTTAEMRLPMASFDSITVNGKAPTDLSEEADGIVYVGTTDGVAVFHLVAGSFNVTCS